MMRLFAGIGVLLILVSDCSHACGNSATTRVTVKVQGTKTTLQCRQVTASQCILTDTKTGKLVNTICRDQCLASCQPALVAPSPAPSPAAVINAIPAGPYITKTTNSKVITLPDPATPSNLLVTGSARTKCPHMQGVLKSWHDPATWGTAIPVAGANVTLPVNTRVLIQQSLTQKLEYVTIPKSSELVFGETLAGIDMTARGFIVQGNLTMGSETCRIETPITVTLWGSRPANAVQVRPPMERKGMIVTGTLNLHGKRYFATWSRLAKTIRAGETVLLLQQPVNWEKGQKVVLTSSIMYDSRAYHQNEVVTVFRVDTSGIPAGVGAVVHLWQPVQNKHIANEYYQVEAGLLSRIIRIQGSSSDSEPTDPDPLNCKTSFPSWHFLYNLTVPCTNTSKTGYGGHVMVTEGGKGFVEGVELYRMGQTNVLGRYPFHFHVLGNGCPGCYLKDSSIHRSFYRCISVHGTNQTTVSENVAYDVTGYCYYLEDGVEEDNTISFNLAAHIHTIGPDMPDGDSQGLDNYDQSAVVGSELTLPADVTASGFYITNVHNNIIGNAASGGWAGFAFPVLTKPLGLHANVVMRPGNANGLTIDGNTAHSTGFWWTHAGAFYVGGSLYTKSDGMLRYNPGRGNFDRDARQPCAINNCAGDNCWCEEEDTRPLKFTNTKTFLTAGVGLNSWTGQMEIKGFEAYDQRLAIEALSEGFWIDNMYAACRTGEDLGLPSPASAARLEGSGFYWYDTGQSHIITNAVFKNCGYRSADLAQYDTSPTRGCGTESDRVKGCRGDSTTFGFLTHSDQFVPEVMQATKGLSFQDCGRRFKYTQGTGDTVSGRCQNWLDVDGTASGLGVPTLIGSGLESAKGWWKVDDDVIFETQGPVSFIKKNNGPNRGLAHVHFSWDEALHAQTGTNYCINGGGSKPCPTQGYVRHLGHKFSPFQSGASLGLPITVNPDTVGPVGGYGWVLKLNGGAPRDLNITEIEIDPSHVLLLSIAYPKGTVFTITANAEWWCWLGGNARCKETMTAVSSVDLVRNGSGNTYYVDSNGVLTFRLFQIARTWVGNPTWFGVPSYNMIARDGINFAVPRYERNGVIVPQSTQAWFRVQATCNGTGVFCDGTFIDYDPNVCEAGYTQVAYDKCCSTSNPNQCTFADGSKVTGRRLGSPV